MMDSYFAISMKTFWFNPENDNSELWRKRKKNRLLNESLNYTADKIDRKQLKRQKEDSLLFVYCVHIVKAFLTVWGSDYDIIMDHGDHTEIANELFICVQSIYGLDLSWLDS